MIELRARGARIDDVAPRGRAIQTPDDLTRLAVRDFVRPPFVAGLPALAFCSSSIVLRITSIPLIASEVCVMLSRMRICISVDAAKSASDEAIFGSFRTSNGCVADWPFAVTRTAYFPGDASGPTIAGWRPQ